MSKFITLDNLKSALTKFKENLSPSLAKLDSITGVVTADKLQNPDHPTDLVAYEAFQAAVPLVQSMNLTGAQVGQTIKVKAVNEQGMPTAWEAADMAGGEEFELIRAIRITESTNAISITTDENGNGFSLKSVFIYCSDSIGKGLDYETISYSDNNGISLSIPNALNSNRVTKVKAENDGEIYSLYGGWAGNDKGTINRYEVVTDSPFTPITSIKITFGAAVSQGSVKVWGKK